MREVIRHFIDEIRRSGFALNTRLTQILLAQLTAFRGAECGEGFRIVGVLRLAGDSCERLRDGGEVRQLHRTLDLRVARQDLLEQSRSRAWQTDDKDRIGRSASEVRTLREEFARQ